MLIPFYGQKSLRSRHSYTMTVIVAVDSALNNKISIIFIVADVYDDEKFPDIEYFLFVGRVGGPPLRYYGSPSPPGPPLTGFLNQRSRVSKITLQNSGSPSLSLSLPTSLLGVYSPSLCL